MRSLQDLYDAPPSSPRQVSPNPMSEDGGPAPSSFHDSPHNLSPQSADEDNTDSDPNITLLLQASRKRPADQSQFADMISREKKFKSEDKKALLHFASVSHFLLAVGLFSHHVFRNPTQKKQFSSIPNWLAWKDQWVNWTRPKFSIPFRNQWRYYGLQEVYCNTLNLTTIKTKIDVLAFRTLVDGEIAGYLVHPIAITEVNIITNPSTVAYNNDRGSSSVVPAFLWKFRTTNHNGIQLPHVSARDLLIIDVQLRKRYVCKIMNMSQLYAHHSTHVPDFISQLLSPFRCSLPPPAIWNCVQAGHEKERFCCSHKCWFLSIGTPRHACKYSSSFACCRWHLQSS